MQWFYLERSFYHYVTTHLIVHHFIVRSALFLKARCHTIETLSLVLWRNIHRKHHNDSELFFLCTHSEPMGLNGFSRATFLFTGHKLDP